MERELCLLPVRYIHFDKFLFRQYSDIHYLPGQTCSQSASVCDSQGCATTGPYALAEFDLSNTGVDFYDVSIIAGVAVPVSITPQIVDSTNSNGNPYTCGNPGKKKNSNAPIISCNLYFRKFRKSDTRHLGSRLCLVEPIPSFQQLPVGYSPEFEFFGEMLSHAV